MLTAGPTPVRATKLRAHGALLRVRHVQMPG